MKSIFFAHIFVWLLQRFPQNKQPNDRPIQEQYCLNLIKY